MENDFGVPRVVELNSLKFVTPENVLCQSTAFEVSAEDPDTGRPQSAISEGPSEKEASLTSMSTSSMSSASSSDLEEHRHLSQSLTSLSLQDCYSSFCSTCSESDLSCSTLEGDSSYGSSFTSDVEGEEEYSDDDGHYKLIQLPISGDSLEFWPLSDEESNSSFNELESSPQIGCKQQDTGQEDVLEQPKEEERIKEEEEEFCLQCHAWPEVEDCRDPPRRFYGTCHHTKIDPYECAFGTSVHLSTVSLSLVDENLVAVAKRKAMESVLSAQFNTLVQQFAVNPERVARTLYGISVIDIIDLGIATAHVLPELERATVLAVSLVRRLRRWPDLFGDVCKVLSDIPAMQEANAKVRRLLYEGFTEDQYSEMLARSVPQHQLHSTRDMQHSSLTSSLNPSNPNLYISAASPFTCLPNSGAVTPNHDADAGDEDKSTSTSYDIIAEDSVSYTSKISGGVDQDPMLNEKSDCACSKVNSGMNLRLHQSCLENRSIRSLDALMADEELDIDASDKNGRTPLIVACLCLPSEKNSNIRISLKQRRKIRNLLVNGADSSIQDYDGNTALHIAALRRDQEVVKLLLDRSYTKQYFSIAVTNKNSRTALHYACYWGDMELVAPLVEFEKEAKSGLISVRDRNGDTGLHIASKGGFKAIIKELLKAKADKNIQNRDGKTAGDVAEETKHNGIAKLLRRKKSRWLFPRKKPASSADQADGGLHRAPSNSSLLSVESNHSDDVFHWSGEESAEEDSNNEEQDLY